VNGFFRALVARVGLALACCSGICVLAIHTGAWQTPANPVMQGFIQPCVDEPHPCWNGIVPGVTSVDNARDRLTTLGYQPGSFNDSLRFYYFYSRRLQPGCVKVGYGRDSDIVSYLRLYCMDEMSIGLFASVGGVPQVVTYRRSTTSGDTEYLAYAPDHPLNGVMLVVGLGWRSVNSSIASIDLFAPGIFRQSAATPGNWHGFIPMWRYCRLEPAYPRCG
jgi:hypothetical protein